MGSASIENGGEERPGAAISVQSKDTLAPPGNIVGLAPTVRVQPTRTYPSSFFCRPHEIPPRAFFQPFLFLQTYNKDTRSTSLAATANGVVAPANGAPNARTVVGGSASPKVPWDVGGDFIVQRCYVCARIGVLPVMP